MANPVTSMRYTASAFVGPLRVSRPPPVARITEPAKPLASMVFAFTPPVSLVRGQRVALLDLVHHRMRVGPRVNRERWLHSLEIQIVCWPFYEIQCFTQSIREDRST